MIRSLAVHYHNSYVVLVYRELVGDAGHVGSKKGLDNLSKDDHSPTITLLPSRT